MTSAMGWLGRELVRLDAVGSTNDEAAARARAGAPHGTVVVATSQTDGRGRQGRRWFSPPGENLYLSVVLRPTLPPPRVPPVTLAAGVAVCDAVRALGVAAELKWPNDVVVAPVAEEPARKLAGVLTEMATRGAGVEFVVVGIGLNVGTRAFPPELPAATSLARELGRPPGHDDVLAGLLGELERWLDVFLAAGPPPIVAAWKARSPLLGRAVRVVEGATTVVGTALDLDDEGALLLATPTGARLRVISGEVTHAEEPGAPGA